MHVEDHPLEYGGFEGIIPEGRVRRRHGAPVGPRHVAARGRPARGLRDGQAQVRLEGEKLRGGWTLVQMRRRRDAARTDALAPDQANGRDARPASAESVTEERPESVATGRTLEEIARRPGSRLALATAPPRREGPAQREPARRRAPSAAGGSRSAPRRAAGASSRRSSRRSSRGAGGRRLAPRDQVRRLPDPRAARQGRVRLLSRNGNDWTERFPRVAEAVARAAGAPRLLDGEVAVLLPDGTTSFQALQNPGRGRGAAAARVLRLRPAAPRRLRPDRRAAGGAQGGARDAARAGGRGGALRYSDHVVGSGADVLRAGVPARRWRASSPSAATRPTPDARRRLAEGQVPPASRRSSSAATPTRRARAPGIGALLARRPTRTATARLRRQGRHRLHRRRACATYAAAAPLEQDDDARSRTRRRARRARTG